MFRNRTSSQKPGDEFIASFRQNFPQVANATSSAGNNNSHVARLARPGAPDRHHSVGGAEIKDSDPTPRPQKQIDPFLRHHSVGADIKDLDSTSEPHNDLYHFQPSEDSYAHFRYTNQTPGTGAFFTHTPGGTTLYHNQAGDLHTPSLGMGLGLGMPFGLDTPLSLPTSTDGLHSHTMMDMSHFGQNMPGFHNYDPFGHSHHHQQQPTSFAPSSFIHQDTGYETMEHDGSPMDEDEGPLGPMEGSMQHSPLTILQPQQAFDMAMSGSVPPSAEKFRFQVTLHAPTAMIKQADEIPITYLNKGQAYSVSVVDTGFTRPLQPGTRYRTFIRISFEDEQQRQRPASCWQLWKEGRGTNEAHQRGGKLQAVEYVEATQRAESEDKRTRVELDTASFDGFSVIWTPGVNGAPECTLAVRFNFLSTDFSHSKGVKGIPVRFCAKTETLPSGSPHANEASEVAFCKVKLFRDHGAERKLANDVAHVKKTIDKLQQQINQAETGMKEFGKRKRGSTTKAAMSEQRPGKVQKHKRTWSMSSASSAGGRIPMEEDLHFKLDMMQSMFTSPRPVSTLYLRGSEQDDPDLHPVALAGEPLDLTKVDSRDNAIWAARSSAHSSTNGNSSIISPSPSSISLQSQAAPTALNHSPSWSEYRSVPSGDILNQNPQQLASPPDQLTRVPKSDDAGSLSGWIEALGVDPSYVAPIDERTDKPVACFYVLLRDPTQPDKHDYHRAVYIKQRTLKAFTDAIALKWKIEPNKIMRTIHVLDSGLKIEMDDDVIQELPEKQDLILEVHKCQAPVKREWEMDVVAMDSDGAGATQNVIQSEGYEFRLIF